MRWKRKRNRCTVSGREGDRGIRKTEVERKRRGEEGRGGQERSTEEEGIREKSRTGDQ